MSSIWSFFRSERALPGSKYPSVHIIELACMIQVFRLICFWAKTKWTYVQREKRNLFSTGQTPFCWISCKWERVQLVPLRLELLFFLIFFCWLLIILYWPFPPACLISRRFTWSPLPLSGDPPGGRSWLEKGCWSSPPLCHWGSPTGYWNSWARPRGRSCGDRCCSTG